MQAGETFRILIIEDDPADREICKHCLRQSHAWKFEFEDAESAAEGIEKSNTWKPHCILLDFNLPGMNGIEALGHLKDASGSTPVAVVMLTAFGGEGLAVSAMKAGAMDYLPKGQVGGDLLPHTVVNAIERFQMQERIEQQRRALESSSLRYQVLLEAIPQMVWTASPAGQVEYANRRWFEYTGLGLEDGVRLGWDTLLHPEDRERTWDAWCQAVKTGSVFEIEHRLRRSSDGSYRWHLVRAVPMRVEGQAICNWLGTCTEIETQKEAEAMLRQEEKLEGIGLLAGGIAHDFNNLMLAVLGNANYAMELLPGGHSAHPLLQSVVDAGERAAELTRKMLAYAGKGNFYREPADISFLVRDTCRILRESIPETIELYCYSTEDLPLAEIDTGQMRHVVRDLVTNAVEAIGEKPGEIYVRIFEEGVEANGDASPYVALEVKDNGCGMDDETRKRAFEPFFTTKFMGRGLGLAAVQGFVRSNGGFIQVESVPEEGACFRIYLPAAEQKSGWRAVAG